MTARIRTIKPEFFRHLELYHAEKETGLPLRVAYAGLWTVADREGRFRWQPEVLKLDVLPFDDLDFSRVLDALSTRGFLVKYASGGRVFGVIPTFKTHQVVNNREKASTLPSPDKTSIIPAGLTRGPRVDHADLISLDQDQVEGELEGELEGEENTTCPIAPKTVAIRPSPGVENPHPPVLFTIPLSTKNGNGKSKDYPITQADIDAWQESYPAVDVLQEVRHCRQWNIDNPTRRKTASGIRNHISTWLSKVQNRGGGAPRGPGSKPQTKTYEHNAAAIRQAIAELQEGGA